MTPAFYADYIADLRILLQEIDQSAERLQTFDAHIELAAAGSLVVYDSKRRKGLNDNLFYGRPKDSSSNQKVSQSVAFSAIDRFFALGQFLALSDGAVEERLHEDFPHCAVRFSYRKKGQPKARSMVMIFIGFNDDKDALDYAQSLTNPTGVISARPYVGERMYEWR